MMLSVSSLSKLVLASLLLSTSVHCTPPMAKEAEEFDWRNDNIISPVSDCRQVGDNAAVVVAEGVESLLALETEQPLVILSRQQVIDCSDEEFHPTTHGYTCITMIGGLCAATDYTSPEGVCNSATCQAACKVIDTEYLPPNREDKMVEAILQTPLTAVMDASHESFVNYRGGIYSQANCSTAQPEHMVQIVGYGTTADGQDYWIIKNSWGITWGESGYMRIVRGQNMCQIASRVFYPIIAS